MIMLVIVIKEKVIKIANANTVDVEGVDDVEWCAIVTVAPAADIDWDDDNKMDKGYENGGGGVGGERERVCVCVDPITRALSKIICNWNDKLLISK